MSLPTIQDLGYIVTCPSALIDIAGRAISEEYGITIPPETVTFASVCRKPQGWSIILEADTGAWYIETDLRGGNIRLEEAVPVTGHLRLVK